MLLRPKEIKITDDGVEKTYVLSKVPATYAREIVAQYPMTALPKIGDYSVNEQMMFRLMGYVGIAQKDGKEPLVLSTRELIDNHCVDLKTLATLEIEMFRYNWDFFLPEDLSNLGARFRRILSTFLTQILTESLRQSSQSGLPPSTNSAPSTT